MLIAAIKKLNKILTKEDKLNCFFIFMFAVLSSILEIVTAGIFVLFAVSITDVSRVLKYLKIIGIKDHLIPENKVILYLSLTCGLTYLIKSLIYLVEAFYRSLKIYQMCYKTKDRILYKYAHTDYSLFLTRNSSYGLSVINEDIESFFGSGVMALSVVLSELMILIGLISIIVYLAPKLALALLSITIILFFLMYKFLFPMFYTIGAKLQEATLSATRNLLVFFSGFKEIIIFGKQQTFIAAYKNYAKQRSLTQAKYVSANSVPRISIELLFVGLFVLVVLFMVLSNQKISAITGVLGGYLYVGFRVMPGLNRIITEFNSFQYRIPLLERIYKEFYEQIPNTRIISIPKFKFEDKVEIKNVSFKYPNTKSNVLNNVNLEIKKNSCIGVVGETGSGKSTLIDLLLGLLHPVTGEILVDGKYPVTCEEWHAIVGYVSQSIYLFDDTIRANIAFGESVEEIDESNLQDAIKIAQLEKFLAKLPGGVDTIIGERGIKLSGGERQRIAIARALYKQPSVLIFDEATSSLDTETESQLMATINELSKNYTIIMVAHRLSTLKNCDRIIKISKGYLEDAYV